MKSIFRYPGGKTRKSIQDWICSYIPPGMKEYREPFVGGGGIFWAVGGRSWDKCWINDRHEGLIEVYKALRDRPSDFIALCREVAPAQESDAQTEVGPRGGKPTNARLKKVFESVALNEDCDQAFRYFFVNRTVHGSGRVNYDIPSRLYFSNPDGWNIVKKDDLHRAARRMESVVVTQGDYRVLLAAPGEDVWIYLDPPYVVNSNLSATSQLYQHSFDIDDHKAFAEAVKQCEHKVCISYDDDDEGFVRSLFEGDFHIEEAKWRYAGTTNDKKEVGNELLILNYKPPTSVLTVGANICDQDEALSQSEEAELAELESNVKQSIEAGRKAFLEIGATLAAIRDSGSPSKRLYRATHDTFEAYCMERWGLSRPALFRHVDAYKIHANLEKSPMGDFLPSNERQYRELSRLPEDQQVEVWQSITEELDETEITATKIRERVNQAIGYEKPEVDRVQSVWKAVQKLDDEQWGELVQLRETMVEEYVG